MYAAAAGPWISMIDLCAIAAAGPWISMIDLCMPPLQVHGSQ